MSLHVNQLPIQNAFFLPSHISPAGPCYQLLSSLQISPKPCWKLSWKHSESDVFLFAAAPPTTPGSFPVGNRTQSSSLEEEHSWESSSIAQDGWAAQLLLWSIANSGFCSCSVLPAVLSFFRVTRKAFSVTWRLKNCLMEALYIFQQMSLFVFHTHKCTLWSSRDFLSFIFFLWCTLELSEVRVTWCTSALLCSWETHTLSFQGKERKAFFSLRLHLNKNTLFLKVVISQRL